MSTVIQQPAVSARLSGISLATLYLLFFTSGFAGLVYEVLWMKELGLLFGNTAQAAATTLAAFFLGIAAGGAVLGRYASRVSNPLRVYALLELGVSISALLYFLLLDVFHGIYTPLFELIGPGHPLFIAAKFLLAVSILFPPAFFMGGTLPVMSQHLVRNPDSIGKTASALYAINTIGATLGAFAAGFYLPRLLGFTNAYLVAIALTSSVALFAWLLGRNDRAAAVAVTKPVAGAVPQKPSETSMSPRAIRGLAFLSGFITLGLEVLWTRMFAQVLQNSVYTFATILVIFLLALATGAAVARILIGWSQRTSTTLFVLLLAGGISVAATPVLFIHLTDGLAYFGEGLNWTEYTIGVFATAATVMLVPGLLLEIVLPYLIKLSEQQRLPTGRTVGDLVAINTTGAVIGSLAAGFVMLEWLGLWASIQAMAALYLVAAFGFRPQQGRSRQLVAGLLPAGALVVVFTLMDVSGQALITLDAENKDESLIEIQEGSAATVAVVTRRDSLRIKVNNYYGLGGTGAHKSEERQSHLPLLLHPDPKTVFYLGMGTGITAGAALQHPVERVTVTELLPGVISATKKYFSPFLHGLYFDDRATVIAEDGRNYLLGTGNSYDVIIADLFIPWKAGTGTLYSQEHYRAALSRLNANGIYAQWLPLFQVSEEEVGIIANTMLSVFPQVTVWRSKFQTSASIMLLAGHRQPGPLDFAGLPARLARIKLDPVDQTGTEAIGREPVPENRNVVLMHYAGNLSQADSLVNHYRINTYDKPVIEYIAPLEDRQKKAGTGTRLTGEALINFYASLLDATPPETDPYLEMVDLEDRKLVNAGLALHSSRIYRLSGQMRRSKKSLEQFNELAGNWINY